MTKSRIFVSIVCCLLAGGAMAQRMFKTVGPDGKITFSDRPQIDADTKVSELRANRLRPVEPAPRRVDPAQAAVAASTRKPTAPLPAVVVLTPEVEQAMVTVMGRAEFGRRFDVFCSATETDKKAFVGANYGWKQRNSPALEQQKRLINLVVSPGKRAELFDKEQQQMAVELGKIAALAGDERKEWCEKTVAEINSGSRDINEPDMMAVPIVPYRAR
ncbi:MAG: DUF4124 domain-containing protein [Pseudomonadota bacterium]